MKYSLEKAKSPRPPLRTITELAEEFGLSPKHLGQLIAKFEGPQCIQNHRCAYSKNKWFDPRAVRVWFAENKDKF